MKHRQASDTQGMPSEGKGLTITQRPLGDVGP